MDLQSAQRLASSACLPLRTLACSCTHLRAPIFASLALRTIALLCVLLHAPICPDIPLCAPRYLLHFIPLARFRVRVHGCLRVHTPEVPNPRCVSHCARAPRTPVLPSALEPEARLAEQAQRRDNLARLGTIRAGFVATVVAALSGTNETTTPRIVPRRGTWRVGWRS